MPLSTTAWRKASLHENTRSLYQYWWWDFDQVVAEKSLYYLPRRLTTHTFDPKPELRSCMRKLPNVKCEDICSGLRKGWSQYLSSCILTNHWPDLLHPKPLPQTLYSSHSSLTQLRYLRTGTNSFRPLTGSQLINFDQSRSISLNWWWIPIRDSLSHPKKTSSQNTTKANLQAHSVSPLVSSNPSLPNGHRPSTNENEANL